MTFTIALKESRAQLVVKELNNDTKIISELDSDGWVRLEVVINNSFDALQLYHSGMEVARQMDNEWKQSRKEVTI
jgi:hypothetical protein